MAIELTDDGTMDTVLRCSECGEEMRYNYDPSGTEERAAELTEEIARTNPHWKPNQVSAMVDRNLYEDFIDWAIEDATADHECAADDAEPTEPQEDDITTTDHETFYQNGKPVLWLTAYGVSDDYDRVLEKGNRWVLALNNGTQITILAKTCEQAVRQYMERSQFWPNVWFISDHGNAHLMTLTEDK